ncbi:MULTISPECIES: MobF family relaxase [Nocardia]|uniref:MobF family relaxase n=1 Tax=Nocardia TaxID=1817 RepID=UPI002454845D|nr:MULTISPECIES: MobF family relaxase [Nocardia]
MSVAKLSAGDGYEYYVRVIATHDANERGRRSLEDYYTERGESPGIWLGSGLGALGISVGDRVSEAQVRALLGEGLHPNADAIIDDAIAAQVELGAKPKDAIRYALHQAQLGRPFGRFTFAEGSYRHECAKAFAAWNTEHGLPTRAAIPAPVREQIRTETAQRMFLAEHCRAPDNARELSTWVARASRPAKTAVAGYDLTFSPVKSVSALWALAPREVAAAIEAAHHAAVRDALAYLEKHAVFTRIGRHSVRQVEVEGLIATAFDHRDSRAGDPDLHTHVVISNKVRRLDGEWGALDGRMIYRHNVAASELYNTRLEHYLEDSLGVVFSARPGTDPGKRPVREVAGVDPRLLSVWSKRRAVITAATAELSRKFRADHGREPTPVELLDLSQQATLATRRGKHAARSHAEQRAHWRADAVGVLGSEPAVDAMITTVLAQTAPVREVVDADWITAAAARTVKQVAQSRATWQVHHIRAEVARQLRGTIAPAEWERVVEQVVAAALAPPFSLPRGVHDTTPAVPELARSDGTSVYTTAGSTLYTSQAILDAEHRLVEASLRHDGRAIAASVVDAAIVEHAANNPGCGLNPGQQALVRTFATSGARLQVGLAPAGTGKTTAMQVLTRAWTDTGATVIGLAPTGSAAALLAEEIAAPTATVDMLVALAERLDRDPEAGVPDWVRSIDDRTLVVLDEAAKCSTLTLDAAVAWLLDRGASIRAIGDDRQLASVAAGGVVRDIVAHVGAATLTRVMRFTDPAERSASLAVREGDPAGLAYYLDHDRVRVGPLGAVVDDAFRAWAADIDTGLDAALLAPTRDLVTALNHRARAIRLYRTGTPGCEVVLADGLSASAGDIICTRRNHYRLPISATDHVRNGYRWQVRTVHRDGRITATHLGSGRRVTLPADYVREHVQLGYATTIDTSQGMTVDTCHGVLTGRESRAQLYVMLTRGRTRNHAYLATSSDAEPASAYTWLAVHPPTALDLLTGILGRDGSQVSAATAAREDTDPRRRLAGAVDAYRDALAVAAEHHLGAETLAAINAAAEQILPGLTHAAAYPVLRQHLATLALSGTDPLTTLRAVARTRELGSADDPAAVLDWRIDTSGAHSHTPGPLPWLPGIPTALAHDPQFGPHLHARLAQINDLREDILATARAWTPTTAPLWAQPLTADAELVAQLAVWRAAHGIDDIDRRLTGPDRYPVAEHREQQRLSRLAADRLGDLDADTRRWKPLADRLDPALTRDPYWPVLAGDLTTAARTGLNVSDTLTHAAEQRPLPVEQPAAALRWRLAADLDERETTDPHFIDTLTRLRDNPLHRMTDPQLEQRITALRRRVQTDPLVDGVLFIAAGQQREADRVQQRHQRMDERAAAIEAAQAADRAAADAARAHFDKAAELAELRAQPTPSKLFRPGAYAEHQAAIEALAAEIEQLRRAAATARDDAEQAARATGVPKIRWDSELAALRDPATRQAELDDAHTRDEREDARRARYQQRLDTAREQLRDAVDELHRRRALTDPERDLEHRARLELHGGRLPNLATEEPMTPTTSSWQRPQLPPPATNYERGPDLGL